MKLLFICRQNRARSQTAERMLQGVPGYTVKSAGLEPSSKTPVNRKLIAWADLVFVMQSWHWLFLEENFSKALKGKQIICLDIPDEYSYGEPELVQRLRTVLAQHIELPE